METTEEITQIPSQTNSEEDAQPMSSDLTPTVPPKASENSESIPPKSSETIPDRLIQEDRADEPVSDASADESVYKVPTDKPVRENSADESVHKTPADESASEQSIDAGSVHNASANKPAPKSDTGESDHEDRPDYLAEAERFQNEENEGSREFLEMKRIRHEKWKKEESRRRRKHILIAVVCACAFCAVLSALLVAVPALIQYLRPSIVDEITVEAGTENQLTAEDFLTSESKEEGIEASFVSDLSEISFDHVGTYSITFKSKGRNQTSTLIVEDTEAPKGEAVITTLNLGGSLEAEELAAEVSDATDVTCEYKETPDYSEEGTVYPIILLTDEGGNITEITSEVTVMVDEEAPVIDGIAQLNAFIDVPVSYKANLIVTDNCDTDVDVEVDTSAVDPDKEGTYEITYTATDRAGNTATASTTITFTEKPEDYIDEETVLAEAQEVLDDIVTDDMTLKQQAKAIYDWVRANIYYVNSTYKESWTNGAHIGFSTGQGDCFIYFSTTKALLTQAGIPNIDVEKSNVTTSHHYWSLVNVGDGWYHLDTTPRESGATFFLVTDEEMLAYFEQYGTYDAFDTSLYPATPTTASTIE